MSSGKINSKKQKNLEINLYALIELQKEINKDLSFVYIGIAEDEAIFIRVINKEKQYYETLFPYLDISNNMLDRYSNVKNVYDWLITRISKLEYNENRTKILFFYNTFNRNIARLEEKMLELNLKTNPKDILIIKNMDSINILNELNNLYHANISIYDDYITLDNKNINNKGFKELWP